MVTDKSAYRELMEYLTSSVDVFEVNEAPLDSRMTVEIFVENEISTQIITLCSQHDDLETVHRSIIVREVDSIVHDIQQVLSAYWSSPITASQAGFISEYTGLIKNVFDSAIADLLD